ncbi:MAG: metallophosphoesterase [Acidobacteriota bacterium]
MKLKFFLIVIFCFSGFISGEVETQKGPELPGFIGPYLQNPGEDSVTVCFITKKGGNPRIIIWKAEDSSKVICRRGSDPIPGTPWTVWKWKVSGLKSGVRYNYLISHLTNNIPQSTEILSFYIPGNKTIKVALFNDLHSRYSTLELLVNQIKGEDYDFSVLLGDCWENPESAEQAFLVLYNYINLLNAGEKPMIFVQGNHEYRGKFAAYMSYLFDLPNLNPQSPPGEQLYYYTLRSGPVWFLIMDCGEDFEKKFEIMQPYREKQGKWLKTLLENKEHKKTQWRVKLSHIPLYNDNIWNSEPSRKMWEQILQDAKINISLAGHDHEYKVLKKSETLKVNHEKHGKWEMTPPYPVMIGGGPGKQEATIMLLEADENKLHIRMIRGMDGSICGEINIKNGKKREN